MNHKRVSILIPLYNTEEYIERCINSIPDRADVEIIVVDDCSTDNSIKKALIALKQKKLTNWAIYRNERNMGVGYTRNILLDMAIGDYIFFLDSDDYIFSRHFSDIVDNTLTDQICVKALHINPFGEYFYCSVHRGDFLLRSFVGNMRHPLVRCHEDTYFKRELRTQKGYKETLVNKILYYYFEPRINSLTWQDKKQRNEEAYQKDEKYWIEKCKPEWYKEHKDEM